MSTENTNGSDVTPAGEPAPTPLVSASQLSKAEFPYQHISEERLYPLEEHARQIAQTTSGSPENHLAGLLGEDAVAKYLGIEDELNTEVYADGGDGGADLQYRGATIDVKTVGRQESNPPLTVNAYDSLTADYYALVSRIGKSDFLLIGYAPREFVANAPQLSHQGQNYHIVDQEYLFPFPK